MTRENLLRYGKEYLRDLETACCEIEELHLNFVRESIKALEQEPILDKIKGYIDYIRNTGMGKKKSLEFIEKFIEGLKVESEDE